MCQTSFYWQRPGGILTTLGDIDQSVQRGDLTKVHSLGEALGRKVDDAAYTLGRAPNWEPGASIKGLLRDGFKTLGDAGEVLTKADTLDEASAVIPQFTEGTTTVNQALALFPGLEREYPDFNCP